MGKALRLLFWFVAVALPFAYGVPRGLALSGTPAVFAPGPAVAIGLVVAVVGTVGLLWCFVEFFRGGEGTPAPYEPPRQLVTRGLYRYSRNPIYAAVLITVVGQ